MICFNELKTRFYRGKRTPFPISQKTEENNICRFPVKKKNENNFMKLL